jgi:hypothetical protein
MPQRKSPGEIAYEAFHAAWLPGPLGGPPGHSRPWSMVPEHRRQRWQNAAHSAASYLSGPPEPGQPICKPCGRPWWPKEDRT